MIIGRLLFKKYSSVDRNASYGYVREIMRETGIRLLPVLEGNKLLGIIRRIDVLGITARRSNWTAADLMEYPRVLLKEDEDLFQSVKKILSIDEWYAPVVDDENDFKGIFGFENFISYMVKTNHRANLEPVEKYMSREIITVTVTDAVSKVWGFMIKYNYDGFPVVDDEGRLVGLISQYDLLKHGITRIQLESQSGPKMGPKVEGIMSTPPITVHPKSLIKEVSRLIIDGNIGRVLVLDKGELVGIIDRENVSRAYLST